MRKLLFVFLLLFSKQSIPVWSAFAHVTPDTQDQYGIEVHIRALDDFPENRPNIKYRVRFRAFEQGLMSAWLVLSREPLSATEQELRDYFWWNKSPEKEIVETSLLEAREIDAELYYEVELEAKEIARSYIYIDFPEEVDDGGYYYSIDFPSYLSNEAKP